MIYRTWSDEFGKRLQDITGTNSDLYKNAFFNKRFEEVLDTFVVANDYFVLPIYVVKDILSEEGNLINITFFDWYYPSDTKLLFNQDFKESEVILEGSARTEYIIEPHFSSFEEHKSTFNRSLKNTIKNCEKDLVYYEKQGIDFEDPSIKELISHFDSYWTSRGELPFDRYSQYKELEDGISTGFFTLDGKIICVDVKYTLDDYLYSLVYLRNTDSEYTKYGLGKYVTIKDLELCYAMNKKLNILDGPSTSKWMQYKSDFNGYEKIIPKIIIR